MRNEEEAEGREHGEEGRNGELLRVAGDFGF